MGFNRSNGSLPYSEDSEKGQSKARRSEKLAECRWWAEAYDEMLREDRAASANAERK